MSRIPLYSDPGWTFRFAEDRRIPVFLLPESAPGLAVTVFRADPETEQPLEALRAAVVESEGRVAFDPPLLVRAGSVLVVLPNRP